MQRPASTAWTLTDGHAGNVRQACALARAMDLDARDITLDPHAPWRWCAPRRMPFDAAAFGPAFAALLHAPPQLAIGCGRQAALATRMLRGRAIGGETRTQVVQILDPRIAPSHWDLVIAPEHDGLAGANVVTLLGSLHPVDDAWLADGRIAFPDLAALPAPRTALLIGGPSAHWPVDSARMLGWIETVIAAARDAGGSVLATTSRRTPIDVVHALRARLQPVPHVLWTGAADGPNPYAGLLAHAQRIACTADSVNMLSEACATHADVTALGIAMLRGRPLRFVNALHTRGRVESWNDATFDRNRTVTPLRETARVADEVRERLGIARVCDVTT